MESRVIRCIIFKIKFRGGIIAIIKRKDDNEDKLVVVLGKMKMEPWEEHCG